jgi:hypothetical protein
VYRPIAGNDVLRVGSLDKLRCVIASQGNGAHCGWYVGQNTCLVWRVYDTMDEATAGAWPLLNEYLAAVLTRMEEIVNGNV